jgi:adenosylcobinamide-GDP ribazoletransferase
MTVLRTISLAFALFSRIPMPKTEWSPKNMRLMLCAFPLVGAVIGLALWGWVGLSSALGLGTLLFAAGLVLIPLLISGGIHLDGWCDTLDALASHASAERKREILKDPHAGVFAVIGLAAYLLATVGLASELAVSSETAWLLALLPVFSRILSGLATVLFPVQGAAGLLSTVQKAADRKLAAAILVLLLVLCASGFIVINGTAGSGMVLAGLLSGGWVYRLSRRQFGGMNGDLAGFYLQLAELAMLTAWVLLDKGGWA